MQKLLIQTTAYKILTGDRLANKLSHAYMLHFQDIKNMREALKLFALEFFGAENNESLKHRILSENYVDLRIYPGVDKKITADGVAEILDDCAMRPVEGNKKLYIICGFDSASPLIQNKLLKTLEEPLAGIHFLLGVTSLAPVLDTVKSRVKLLDIPPFTQEQIFNALERNGHREINREAARSANGILGIAESLVAGGWFADVVSAAKEICFTVKTGDIGEVALKYGESKYKAEILSQMQKFYFSALTEGGELEKLLGKPTLIYALENIDRANADLKFNAYFQGLLYDFMLSVNSFRKKAVRLQGD